MNSRAASSPKSATRRLASHTGNAYWRANASRSAWGLPKGNSPFRDEAFRSTALASPHAFGAKVRTSSTHWSTAAWGLLSRKYISYTPMRSASRTSSCTSSGERRLRSMISSSVPRALTTPSTRRVAKARSSRLMREASMCLEMRSCAKASRSRRKRPTWSAALRAGETSKRFSVSAVL